MIGYPTRELRAVFLKHQRFHVEHRAQSFDADRRGVSRCLDKRTDNGQNNKELPPLKPGYTYKRQCKGHAVDSVLYSASVIERGQ